MRKRNNRIGNSYSGRVSKRKTKRADLKTFMFATAYGMERDVLIRHLGKSSIKVTGKEYARPFIIKL